MSISYPSDLIPALEDVLQKTANRMEIPLSTLRQEIASLSDHLGIPAEDPLLPEELLLLCLLIRTAD